MRDTFTIAKSREQRAVAFPAADAASARATSLPRHGQIVVFSKVPPGSYASEGVAYRVDRPKDKGDFRFVNVERGSSTIDRPWAVKMSVWEAA